MSNQPDLNDTPAAQPDGAAEEPGAFKKAQAGAANLISEHKGKLAVGAAAMLGLAVFYKWREGRLAKEDPDEYARLRRLKAAVEHDAQAPRPEG